MLKVSKLNKYYNKGKQNELHVLNDIDLNLDSVGFVVIKGQSGSGKTTLLNSICGLDKVDSGSITVDNNTFTKYSNKWDKVRNQEYGYIFQNYNIFEEETVFDNVSLSLEMLGMKDKEEIRSRVMTALTLVGLEKYRNRLAGNLSGGEQQRVAIARAIVKSPKIIIADEPTGNLDEKNTIIIMNILKKIAADRLVVVVTHEKDIADFYADTLINISDGKIISIEQSTSKELKLYADSTIYLKDMQKEELAEKGLNITTYYDKELDTNIQVRLIVKNENIIVDVKSDNKRIKYETNDNKIEIIDDHKKVITKEDIDKQVNEVKLDSLDISKLSGKYNIGFWKYMKKGFSRIFDLSKFKKIFLVGFFISSLLLMLCLSAYFGVSKVDETSFLVYDRSLMTINYSSYTDIDSKYNDLITLKEKGIISDFLCRNYDNATITGTTFYQTNEYTTASIEVKATYVDSTKVSYKGKTPAKGEVVIDQLLADKIFATTFNSGNTIKINSQLLAHTLDINGRSYKIVDVVTTNNGCIYVNPDDYNDFYSPYLKVYKNEVASIATLKDNEIVIDSTGYYASYGVGAEVHLSSNPKTYKVVGVVAGDGKGYGYVNEDQIVYNIVCNAVMSGKIDFHINVNQKEAVKEIKKLGYKDVEMRYDADYKDKKQENLQVVNILLILTLVTIIAPLIFLYFLMRSSMISRIKETGIYRALGMSKFNIIKIHASEILAISVVGSLPGWLFAIIIILKIYFDMPTYHIFSASPLVMLVSISISFIINLLVGCIPIMMLLSKTPKEILAKYDI